MDTHAHNETVMYISNWYNFKNWWIMQMHKKVRSARFDAKTHVIVVQKSESKIICSTVQNFNNDIALKT